ncbi:MAG TPA: recombinase family protein [Terriglobales bacterium]|nr:recombinase family protein [Terriglobales bacterium]
MARTERMRQEVPQSFGVEDFARRTAEGWKLVAVEWQRELPETDETAQAEEVPFGLQIGNDPSRLEVNPAEQDALFLMMEMTVQEGPYTDIAEELNRRGYRTREGFKWTAVSVFQMLPRLIEVGPKIFATREWQLRKSAAKL